MWNATVGSVATSLGPAGWHQPEALQELRQLRPDVCVILCSGFSEEEVTCRLTGKELADFLQRPFSASQLIIAAQRALGG
jgi:DNA-binding NtrC family response regulator